MTGRNGAALVIVALIALALLFGRGGAEDQNQPGEFDYYVLVLGWSPSYCKLEGRKKRDRQCDMNEPRSFVLHGLWPQYDKGWPLDCPTEDKPWVPRRVIDEMLDIMPSSRLIIHEYRAHGTCSGQSPAQYYSTARELYKRIKVPPRFASPTAGLTLSPEEIERDFLVANDWLKPDMLAVTCRGQNLLDVRVCFGRDLFPTKCGVNEDEKRLCDTPKISVPRANH
ncbi:MAG: ribonuclease T2 family protein [Methyloceanibacter sp.]|uniref:ribonuclease T2 family protein n=1 Tax=Methyloceanibacter sp. TaxID=1965321 RepID=UPI003D9AE725